MALAIYKPGQGYWTRMLSGIGAGVIILAGVAWLWAELMVLEKYRIYIQSGVAAVLVIGLGLLIFHLLNKPRIADFMIATEAEMRKVNWPTRREIIGSTWVVICGTFLMATFLLAIDIVFFWIFSQIGILEG